MKIIALGAGGWLPLHQKTSSFMVEYKNSILILDAGTGILNLDKFKNEIKKYETVHIILTHYHLDHIIGLTYLDLFFDSQTKIKIYAPGKPFYSEGPEKILNQFMHTPYTPKSIHQTFMRAQIIEYSEKAFMIDDILVTPKVQIHTDYSFSIDIDQKVLYKTDTEFDLQEHLLTRNQYDYILLECWGFYIKETVGHTYFQQIMNLKNTLNVKTKVLLIHIDPLLSHEEKTLLTEKLSIVNAHILKDLETFISK